MIQETSAKNLSEYVWGAAVIAPFIYFMIFSVYPQSARAQSIQYEIMEGVPSYIAERRMQQRNEILDALKLTPASVASHPFLVLLSKRKWKLGKTLTVAFKGGNPMLHGNIARVATEWAAYANIAFDFGHNQQTGTYRQWSVGDQDYSADIRIAFQSRKEPGFWSSVGTESRDPAIVPPGEQSMNLEKFDRGTPPDWERVVRHEFGHALGLEHEHQHPRESCDWRWEDDKGYVVTRDQYKQFIPDKQGRRPGIYRVLGGPPNKWPRKRIDDNLRQFTNSSAYGFGDFDKDSIMKYHFDAWMLLKGKDSKCYSEVNDEFSKEDKARIAVFYPKSAGDVQKEIDDQLEQISNLLSQVRGSRTLSNQLRVKQLQLQ
jgi:hypothetical protein